MNNLSSFDWLIGQWDYVDISPESSETWQLCQDGTMEGKGFTVIDGTETQIEDMTISIINQNAVFTLRADMIITLQIETYSDNSIIFVNPDIDFPNKLTYIKLSDTLRQTIISGKLDNKQTDMTFELKKRLK